MPRDYGRYIRQIALPELGLAGQRRIDEARVFVIGAGGLGSPVLLYLAAAGVGQITFIESDIVELSNLHRQPLYHTEDVGRPKAEVAARRLRQINPEIEIQPVQDRLQTHNATAYLKDQDLIIETSDNFPTKFLANDAAVLQNTPIIMAGILRFEGMMMSIHPGRTACYRCVFHAPPPEDTVPDCAQAGVLGAMAGVVGSWQAVEALQILGGNRAEPFSGLTQFDMIKGISRQVQINRNVACPVCGEQPEIEQLAVEYYQAH